MGSLPSPRDASSSQAGFGSFILAGNWQFVCMSQEREAEMQNFGWKVWEHLELCHCLSLCPWAPHLPWGFDFPT